jgi:hypothetical protein
MDGTKPREALKVPDVDRQQLRHAMNVHSRSDSGIMDLYASDFLFNQQPPPAVMNLAAVGQQLKISFDYACDAVRLRNAQSESQTGTSSALPIGA